MTGDTLHLLSGQDATGDNISLNTMTLPFRPIEVTNGPQNTVAGEPPPKGSEKQGRAKPERETPVRPDPRASTWVHAESDTAKQSKNGHRQTQKIHLTLGRRRYAVVGTLRPKKSIPSLIGKTMRGAQRHQGESFKYAARFLQRVQKTPSKFNIRYSKTDHNSPLARLEIKISNAGKEEHQVSQMEEE
ncbi:hypothetical protein FALBO_5491 [Fusarium albosuccineum]|uniref:Uncharacterized protein n=1 Tax=Fusarium albosuccineum TaxID=1237068 RepID=A0A8H4LHL0_9HYPO|nr:hypothetical protein FALBO_5491 [Fusarium albosuccineum]KAF5011245.1 hypothetical protein FDECE_2644 [Fusarium decemcellulare]